jgi:hypothetical protein
MHTSLSRGACVDALVCETRMVTGIGAFRGDIKNEVMHCTNFAIGVVLHLIVVELVQLLHGKQPSCVIPVPCRDI